MYKYCDAEWSLKQYSKKGMPVIEDPDYNSDFYYLKSIGRLNIYR